MWHPLLKSLAAQPDLWAAHAGAYADLAAAEAAQLQTLLGRRLLLAAATLLCAALATGLGGVALLLVATLPAAQMPWPAGLWLVPAVPLALALIGAIAWQRHRSTPAFAALREQLKADAELLSQAGRA